MHLFPKGQKVLKKFSKKKKFEVQTNEMEEGLAKLLLLYLRFV
jgi:hypothetical protein